MQQQGKVKSAARGAVRSRLLWFVAAGLAFVAVALGKEGASNALLALGLVSAARIRPFRLFAPTGGERNTKRTLAVPALEQQMAH